MALENRNPRVKWGQRGFTKELQFKKSRLH